MLFRSPSYSLPLEPSCPPDLATGQALPLLLLMLRIGADDHDGAVALDHSALIAANLNRRGNFHFRLSSPANKANSSNHAATFHATNWPISLPDY